MNLANKITISRIFLVPIFMLFIVPVPNWVLDMFNGLSFINDYGKYVAAFIFILAASTDKVDGYIARSRNQVTKFGKFLDPIADKLLITAALISLVERNEVSTWAAMIIIGREIIITGFRLVAAGEGNVISAGWLGKLKMVIQVVAVVLALLNNYPFSLITAFPLDDVVMWIAVIITVYSGVDYIAKNANLIDDRTNG
jgi:CDP-diacylglycerol--glycerol-3-phosphate 3-phosphatidyltransferase